MKSKFYVNHPKRIIDVTVMNSVTDMNYWIIARVKKKKTRSTEEELPEK